MGIWEMLSLDMARDPRVALVGGGGKTTLLYALARQAVDAGARVLVTTTTHMWPHPGILLVDSGEEVEKELRRKGIVMLGELGPAGKVGGIEGTEECLSLADVVLAEADGSRGLPLKAPAVHEPALPAWAQAVIAVAGLDCMGQPIETACHRPERVCALLGKGPGHCISPGDVAEVLCSPAGGRKDVEDRLFRCCLNQADDPQRTGAARLAIVEMAKRDVLGVAVHFEEKERGGLCWF